MDIMKQIFEMLPPGLNLIVLGMFIYWWISNKIKKDSKEDIKKPDQDEIILELTQEDFIEFKTDVKDSLSEFKGEILGRLESIIKSEQEARKQQWDRINKNSSDLKFMEGYLTRTNGFKKEK